MNFKQYSVIKIEHFPLLGCCMVDCTGRILSVNSQNDVKGGFKCCCFLSSVLFFFFFYDLA